MSGDLGITIVRKFVTTDGQQFDTRELAVAHQVQISSDRVAAFLAQVLDTAATLEAGNITLAQFNNNRLAFVTMLRRLVAIARGGIQ